MGDNSQSSAKMAVLRYSYDDLIPIVVVGAGGRTD